MLTDAYGIRTLCCSSCKLIATGTAGHNASRPAPHCCRLVNGMANLMASSQKFHDDSCCNRFMPPPSSGRRMLLSRCLSRCSAPTLAFFRFARILNGFRWNFAEVGLITRAAMQSLENQIWRSRLAISTKLKLWAVQHVHLTNIPVWFGLLGDV